MSRKLSDLHPKMQPLVMDFLQACSGEGIDLLITCTYRSPSEQAELFAQGRTAPGRIVTNARPGQSMHNVSVAGIPASLAVDVVPLRMGKPVWDGSDPVWAVVAKLGKESGLAWGGDWTTFRELAHFQHPQAKELSEVIHA